jgi:putative ABC transport system permease protein
MDWIDIVRERVTRLSGGPPDPEFVEELAAHLAQVYEQSRIDGLSDDEARRRAEQILEGHGQVLEALKAKRPPVARRVSEWSRREPPAGADRGGFMRAISRLGVLRDARYAVRMLVHTPGFSLVAMLTFAIGIGVNTAVFSVVDGVLLRPLPYPKANEITMVWLDNTRQKIKEDITSFPNYRDWRDQNTSYAHLAGVTEASFTLTGAGEPERLEGVIATANYFDVMGVGAIHGRVFTSQNETPGQDGVIVISEGLWQRRFGGAQDVLGRTISLNGRPHEIIGVMPASLKWPGSPEVWKPLAPDQGTADARNSFWLPVMGRLKPGVSVEQAQTEMSGISARIADAYPSMRGFGAYVVGLQEQMVGSVERPLIVLMAAVAFVLLIACANLANLMLGRTAARRKELAIRTALGAGRARIIRQIVTESLVLAFAGGGFGVLLAYWARTFFVTLGGDRIPRADLIALDGRVLGFAAIAATVAALLSGLVPALDASRSTLNDALREGGRQGGGAASGRTRSVLVAAEVALALVLLTGAGLLLRTLWSMQRLDRGFSVDRIATATISLPGASYQSTADVRAFYGRLLDRIRSLPGVESAATTTGVLMPLLANSSIFTIEGRPLPPPEERIEYPVERVSPQYFETLGIRLARGRTFTDQDHPDAPVVIVINETLAKLGWPDQDPIGRRMRSGGEQSRAPWMTVVGVIKDVHRGEVKRAVRPELYMCANQITPRTQMLVVRTAGDPAAIIPAVRRELRDLDPQLPLFRVNTLAGSLSDTLVQPRFQATLLAGFAAMALLLAAVGIYGVTSTAVSQQIQEVGVRMALGARRADVLSLMLRRHLRPALAGVVIGLASSILLSRSLQSLLYGVNAGDPVTLVLMAFALIAVASAACWIPVRRATRVDPLVALRAE